MIQDNFKMQEDISLEKINLPLTCVFDMQQIKTPCRGKYCTHLNVFSLENFASIALKNQLRRWKCPICRKKSYDIVIDSYLLEIL